MDPLRRPPAPPSSKPRAGPDSARTPSWRATVLVSAASGMLVALDTTVNIAFPAITEEFDLSVTRIQWVVVCYVLTYASLLLASGRLADTFGHRRMLLAGFGVSAAGLLACGAATDYAVFLAARVLQGVGAALLLGPALALVTLAAPEHARSRALGTFQMGTALGIAGGPPLGGVLVEAAGWRSVYLFRVPVALVLLVLAVAAVPGRRPGIGRRTTPLDLPGALTIGAGIAALLLAASRIREAGFSSPMVMAGATAGVVLLAVWLRIERRAADPVIRPDLLRVPAFALANGLNLAANGTMFAIWLLAPYFLLTVRGHSSVVGGAILGASAAGMAFTAPLAGRLADRVGAARLATIGLTVEAAGLAAIAFLDRTSGTVAVVAAFGLVGSGLGLFQVPNLAVVMGAIPPDQQGVAGGLTQMVRTVGVSSGVAFASLLFAARRSVHGGRLGVADDAPATFVPAFGEVFAVVAAVCALAAAASMLRPGRRAAPLAVE